MVKETEFLYFTTAASLETQRTEERAESEKNTSGVARNIIS